MADRIVIMKDGVIQQIDTPENLYRCPVNQFVAGFIGMPQMYFLPATVHRQHGVFWADIAGNAVALPQGVDYGEYVEKGVVLGIRPEHILIGGGPQTLDAKVVLREMMGAEIYLHLEWAGHKLVCRTTQMETTGGHVAVFFDAARLLLFDRKTGETIGMTGQA